MWMFAQKSILLFIPKFLPIHFLNMICIIYQHFASGWQENRLFQTDKSNMDIFQIQAGISPSFQI